MRIALLVIIFAGAIFGQNQKLGYLNVEVPKVVLKGVPFDVKVKIFNKDSLEYIGFTGIVQVMLNNRVVSQVEVKSTKSGVITVPGVIVNEFGSKTISVIANEQQNQIRQKITVRVIPGVLSLLPPVLAIVLALVARQVLLSLFFGIWLGATFIYGFDPIQGFLKSLDTYFVNALADPGHSAIIIFSMTLGGMVGVISKSGGMRGIIEKISKVANHPRSGQLATWLMGVIIFFDDYANTLIVGNTMRSFTDKLRISREKLSYIVDSTAAPVASIALISTWVGFQVGLIDQAFNAIKFPHDAYIIFIQSIPYSAYSILAIVFVFLVGFTMRDFGPMFKAELRSLKTGKVLRDGAQPLMDSSAIESVKEDVPLRWYNGLIPVAVVILATVFGLYYSGYTSLGDYASKASLRTIISSADSFDVLMWASFLGLSVAMILTISQKILNLQETIDAALTGYKSMILAAMILILAWSIGKICEDLNTAEYVISLTKNIISPKLLPALTFVTAALISFSTGTSWATMAILTPIAVPMAYRLSIEAGLAPELQHQILIATVGAVLSGSVFGDHCSPISDTTIMSSMASAADHIDHVRTQLPYAVTVAVTALVTGYLPYGFGLSPAVSILIGIVTLTAVIFLVGKKLNV